MNLTDKKYLLFDLDGTLTDPMMGITGSVAYALGKFGINVDDRRELYKFIGPPLKWAFCEYYGFTEEQATRARDYYRERFSTIGKYENEVYDGIPGLLDRLKQRGKTLIVATAKPEDFSVDILTHFGLGKYFDFVCGATHDDARTKKEDVIEYALSTAKIPDKSLAVMIGDRNFDIVGAKLNGLESVGVTYGYGSREELEGAGALAVVDTVEELGGLLIGADE